MKYLFIAIFFIGGFHGTIQAQLNDYKYIIVPKKFSDFKKENQYLTSTLIKRLFVQKGFDVVYEDALPEELSRNRCLGLTVDVKDNSSMFRIKTVILLKDCTSKEIMVTEEGKSKFKEYNVGYPDAIKNAFSSFDEISYSYKPKPEEVPITVSFKDDVKKLKDKNPENNETLNEYRNSAVKQEATLENQSYKNLNPVPSEIVKSENISEIPVSKIAKGTNTILYAQELPNGFQLVDSTPKIQMKIFKTSVSNIYIAQSDSKNGVVYNKGGKWIFEYYVDNQMMIEELSIKF